MNNLVRDSQQMASKSFEKYIREDIVNDKLKALLEDGEACSVGGILSGFAIENIKIVIENIEKLTFEEIVLLIAGPKINNGEMLYSSQVEILAGLYFLKNNIRPIEVKNSVDKSTGNSISGFVFENNGRKCILTNFGVENFSNTHFAGNETRIKRDFEGNLKNLANGDKEARLLNIIRINDGHFVVNCLNSKLNHRQMNSFDRNRYKIINETAINSEKQADGITCGLWSIGSLAYATTGKIENDLILQNVINELKSLCSERKYIQKINKIYDKLNCVMPETTKNHISKNFKPIEQKKSTGNSFYLLPKIETAWKEPRICEAKSIETKHANQKYEYINFLNTNGELNNKKDIYAPYGNIFSSKINLNNSRNIRYSTYVKNFRKREGLFRKNSRRYLNSRYLHSLYSIYSLNKGFSRRYAYRKNQEV